MTLIDSMVMNLRWPVGCPPVPKGKDPTEFAREWVRKNPDETQLRKTSYAAYAGLGVSVFGIIAGLFGKFKENNFLKVLGWTVGWMGAATAIIGKLFGLEFDIANGVKHTVIAGGTNGKQITPSELKMKADKVDITSGGEKLDAYYIYAPKEQTKKTLIYIHGIRNNVGDCLKEIKTIQEKLNVNVIVFDPRGFGNSKLNADSITCQGLNEDTQAVYDYLKLRRFTSEDDISVFGHSLGGAMAVQLAKNNKVDTLILQSTFTDAEQARKGGIGGYLPDGLAKAFGLLGLDDFNSEADIAKVQAEKVITIHGDKDTVVTCKHSETLSDVLFKSDVAKGKRLCAKLPSAGHGDYIDFYEKAELYDPSSDGKKDAVILNLFDTLNEYILGPKKEEHDETVLPLKSKVPT